jgi:Amt family ammonium transporter
MDTINSGDTAFMLISSALVMLMTFGLAFFYGGLVRKKNVLGIMMQSFVSLGLVTAIWVIVGYSLAFGTDRGGLIGGPEFFGLNGVGADPHPVYGPTIPHSVFMMFQLMFAIITPALITGAFADRKRFSRWLHFMAIWLIVIYIPLAHWIWGGGFLAQWGVIDFAGGYVVHMSAGWSALACVFVFKPRKVGNGESVAPHSVPFVGLGAGMLWFGWFGFNAGSALAANAVAANAFVTTMIGGAFGLLAWMFMSWSVDGKPSASGTLTGAVAGLATVTPASGFVAPWAAIVIGIAAGVGCFFAAKLRARMKWDDSLDVWACHGVGGTIGVVCTGLFATTAVNPAGKDGLIYGGVGLFGVQLAAAALVAIFSFAGTYLILRIIRLGGPIQVPEDGEEKGLDHHEHGEAAYA